MADLVNLDQQNMGKKSKFRYLTSRSENFEKQLAELVQSLSNYAKRVAKLRDSGDEVAQTLNTLSLSEVLNPSLKKSTLAFSKTLEIIQGHRDQEVIYFEDKLLPSISQFGENLQKQREEIRSTSNKLFEGRDRSSSWIKSTNTSTRRRSQSAERSNKGERVLQQSIQRYELQRNLILKKFMMQLILSEMQFTIGSLNQLTSIYKKISRELNPIKDLNIFNEFFDFRPLNKSILAEVEKTVNGLQSTETETDSNDNSSDESGLEENEDSDERSERNSEFSFEDDSKRANNSEDDSELSKGDSTSIQSTLRRFNSTPEIPTDIGAKRKNTQVEIIKNANKHRTMPKKSTELNKTKTNKQSNTKDESDDSESDSNSIIKSDPL